MKKTKLTMPELSLIAVTRVALGGGLGLLYANRLSRRKRRRVGWTLFLVGAVSTVPLMSMVLAKRR